MSKKLYFLISFVLVLGLSGLVQADAIEVNNPSFELDSDGNQVDGHQDLGVGWEEGVVGFVGVDTFCPYATGTPEHCHNWPGSDDPCGFVYCYIQNTGDSYIYQVLDMNNSDANGVIVAGRMYELTVDSLTEKISASTITSSFFYGDNPDANQLASKTHTLEIKQRPMEDCTDPAPDPGPTVDYCRDWNYDLRLRFVAEAGKDYLGKILGIKFATPLDDNYNFVDNVRLEWSWASSAYDPDPADEAEDVPIDVNLSWGPGLWAADVNGHEVYFGTSYAEVHDANTSTPVVYRGPDDVTGPDANNRFSYVIPDALELGKTYYWRIDEVNEDWGSGPVPPVNYRWKGDVWSFRTTGLAYNVYPADGAEDIPALNLLLRWEAGTDANGHDVYFGSDEAAVEDANTNTAGIYRGPTQALADVNYLVEPLEVGKSYYWRIDEVNVITVKGDVWSFTTGVFLIVDSFDSYVDKDALRAAWDTLYLPKNGAELSLETSDANMILGGEQSMLYAYRNTQYNAVGPVRYYVGSEAEAALPLEIGTDWTAGGVKALVLYFYGDADNGQTGEYFADYHITNDQMYVALDDGSTEGVVEYDEEHGYDMNDIKKTSWQEWNISLQDPCLIAVDMNNVAKVYIGFGGQKTGQMVSGAGEKSGNFDTVWFDDIRLYPPRCVPKKVDLPSLGDFTEDCNTDYFDFDIMAEDWLMTDGNVVTENRPAALTGFPDTTSHWTTDCAVGTGAIEANEGWNIDVTDPRLFGLESMSITAWVKQTIDNSWVGVVSSREGYPGCGDDASEIGIYGAPYGGPDGLGYDWSCGTEEWQFDAGLDVPEDGTWTFIAVSVDPTGATLYMQPSGGAFQTGVRNTDAHDVQKNFADHFTIGSDDKGSYFVGKIDDVRIYGYNLDDANVALLAGGGEPNPPPVYWYKFDETTGLVAADSGFGMDRYAPVQSRANITDPEAQYQRSVNFRDYRILADNWLEQHPWP